MKIVFDTNVLIAAFISRGVCAELFEYCIYQHTLITSEFILKEFRRNLTEKFKIARSDVRNAVNLLRTGMKVVKTIDKFPQQICKDADDDFILATAVSGQCQCLITGDKELLAIKKFRNIDIISPREFWKYELKHSDKS